MPTRNALPAQITFQADGRWITEKVARRGSNTAVDPFGVDFFITASGRKFRALDVVIF